MKNLTFRQLYRVLFKNIYYFWELLMWIVFFDSKLGYEI